MSRIEIEALKRGLANAIEREKTLKDSIEPLKEELIDCKKRLRREEELRKAAERKLEDLTRKISRKVNKE